MRYAFGLVGLLVGVAVMVWAFAEHTAPLAKVAVKQQDRARQMAGRDESTGEDASRALTLEPAQHGTKILGMTVKAIVPGSAMEKFYGLKADDVITQAGDMPLTDQYGNDIQLAAGMILEAYKASKPLGVTRAGQQISLPQDAAAAVVPAPVTPPAGSGAPDPFASPAAPAAQPAAAAPPKQAPTQQGGLQHQLDILRDAGGQR